MLVVLPAGLEAHHDPAGIGFQQLRGQPRHGVGLMHRRGNPHFCGGLYRGIAGVATGADDHIRPERPQDRPRFRRGTYHIEQGHQIMANLRRFEGPVKAGNMDGAEIVSRLGDQILFQPPLRPHKEDLHVRVLLRHQLRHGNGRVDMARRAAAGEDHPVNALFHHTALLFKGTWQPHILPLAGAFSCCPPRRIIGSVLPDRPKRRGLSTPPLSASFVGKR